MSRVPREYVDGFADSLEVLSDDMKQRLAEELAQIDWSMPVADVRNALIPIMQAYCGASADVAATLAAEFYDGLRTRMIGSPMGAVNASGYSDAAVEQVVRAAVQPLVDDGAAAHPVVEQMLVSRLGYEVKSAAGHTIFRNGERDRARVRFARVPRGSRTYPHGCPFCVMLASRGFVYKSAATAGELNHYHDGCQCMVVPGFGSNPSVEGYNPSYYLDLYRHPEKQVRIDDAAKEQRTEE